MEVERSFSHGGMTVSKRRHNLSDDSTRAAAVLSNWMTVPNLVPEQTIVELFRSKKKRTKKVSVPADQTPEVITVD